MCSLTVGLNNTLKETDGGNQEWTIQRHWQHWSHKTQDKSTLEKTEGVIKNGQFRDTGNIGFTRRRQTKQE